LRQTFRTYISIVHQLAVGARPDVVHSPGSACVGPACSAIHVVPPKPSYNHPTVGLHHGPLVVDNAQSMGKSIVNVSFTIYSGHVVEYPLMLRYKLC